MNVPSSTVMPWKAPPLERSSTSQSGASIGYWLIITIPLASMLCLDGVEIAGFNYTGWIWAGQLLAALFCLQAELAINRHLPVAFPYQPWLVWCGLLALSLLWCDAWTLRNVQDMLQVGMPVLIGCTASIYVRTPARLRLLLRLFGLAVIVALLLLCAMKAGLIGRDTTESQRGLGLTAAVAGTVLIAGARRSLPFSLPAWAFCLVVTVLTGSRMATFALMLAPVFHPLYRSLLLKLATLVALAGLGVAVFYTPIFQERFFDSGSGTLSDVLEGDFLSLGRFESWPDIWYEAWQRPVLGHGIGTATKFVSIVWPEVSLVHNDYLRVGFELGLVGLAVFLLVTAWQMAAIRRQLRKPLGHLPEVQHALAAAFLGLVVFLIMACTDNPLTYNVWFTNPVFVLLGGAYGVLDEQAQQERYGHHD
jgi:O-antigen ligase